MQVCDVWILGWRKLIAGSENVGSWLSVVGVPILCIYWQFSLGQWMLENTAREVRAGEWDLLYDSTSQCPGSCESLAGEWNRGQKLISCFAIFFFIKRSFFISLPVHLFCAAGAGGRASKITGSFPTCCSGTGWYLCSLPALCWGCIQSCTGSVWLGLLPHLGFLMRMSGTSLIWSKSGCYVTQPLWMPDISSPLGKSWKGSWCL